jgi:hypothetical protein
MDSQRHVLVLGPLPMQDQPLHKKDEATKVPSRLEKPTPAPQADSPLGVVQAYYADVNRHDVEAAQGKWKTPPSRLQDMVQRIEWFRIDDIQLVDVDDSAAHVTVVVTGKRRDQAPERWGGTIALEKRAGVWQIVTMPLTKQ